MLTDVMPKEVETAIGHTMKEENIRKWWLTSHSLLGDKSPRDLWEKGDRKKVLDFIESAKSGDMA